MLHVDGLRIELTRKQVRNINLRVRRDGTVAVSAPQSVPIGDIESLVRRKRDWIVTARERTAKAAQKSASSCDEGATVTLWGQTLTVRTVTVAPQDRWPRCSFAVKGDVLVACVDERIVGDGERACFERDRQLDRWLQEALIDRIIEVLPGWEKTVGRRCAAWRLKRMKSRWGSCNTATGLVALSTELVHHSPRCLDYVIVHELCHLYEPSHNARFHALMDRFYPAWREVRRELNSMNDDNNMTE